MIKKTVAFGHNVSNSNRKTNRPFYTNVHNHANLTACSEQASKILGNLKSLPLCNYALRSIDKYGGLDGFLLNMPKSKLTDLAISLRVKLIKAGMKPSKLSVKSSKTEASA